MRTRITAAAAALVALALTGACTRPAPEKSAAPAPAKLRVGLVTDTGGVNDKSFNQSSWAGAQRAARELGFEARFIESKQPTDYEKNLDQFASEHFDAVVSVGFLMGDATAAKARQYPGTKFAIVDTAYFPAQGDRNCPETVKDCYVDGGLTNVTSLLFAEDEVGFLAGVVAGGMTRTGVVCSVSGMEIPPVVRFVTGFQNGARWARPGVKTLNAYIPSFTDAAKGKETATQMAAQGCDVGFCLGGSTGNGGLLGMKEKGLMAIGVDVDQYESYPEVRTALLTSAAKNVDAAVFAFLKSVKDGTVKGGMSTASLKNGGVGLAPYHDWEARVPQAVRERVAAAAAGIVAGTVPTGYRR
jgi:basic membrane protein A